MCKSKIVSINVKFSCHIAFGLLTSYAINLVYLYVLKLIRSITTVYISVAISLALKLIYIDVELLYFLSFIYFVPRFCMFGI